MTERISDEMSQKIADNISAVKERIATAAIKSGKNPDDITLLGVSKTKSVDLINVAIKHGITSIGENYVAEITQKAPLLSNVDIHMIGHLQTNKIKQVIPHINMLHTLDSARLAQKLENELIKEDKILDVLIEINIGCENAKAGILKEELDEMLEIVEKLPHLRLRGLMCIPPICEISEKRKYFSSMFALYIDIMRKKLHNRSNIDTLSMGMSDDYECAISEGATTVRIGSAIFGTRK